MKREGEQPSKLLTLGQGIKNIFLKIIRKVFSVYHMPLRVSQVAQWKRICLPMHEMWGSVPGVGRAPREGNGDPLQ